MSNNKTLIPTKEGNLSTRESAIIGAIRIYLLAAVIGLVTGGLASAFHYCLDRAVDLHAKVASLFSGSSMNETLAAALLGAAMAAIAAVLVRTFAPEAAGSGVQEIEGALQGLRNIRWQRVIGVKFVGGVLAIGAGLLLGREGPTIHMGGCVGKMIGGKTKSDGHTMNTLVAAGAGAGLSTAFSAPLAGVIFVTEEMRKRFDYNFVSLHAVIIACVIAKVVNDQVFGMTPPLPLHLRSWLPAALDLQEVFVSVSLYLILGILIGVCGTGFNTGLVACLRITDRLSHTTMLFVASTLGAAGGALLVVAPEFAGGGESMIRIVFSSAPALGVVVVLFAGRVLMTFLSYSAGVPGGIFAPMLALGTLIGIGFGSFVQPFFPYAELYGGAFAIAAMGGLFAATVRAPLTGIVLVAELTGNFELLTVMILTCLTASVTAQLMGSNPIYEVLLARTLGAQSKPGYGERAVGAIKGGW
jgi:CIC family chloride channel protein